MARTVGQELLDAARNYLDITWPDPAGDRKLSGILARGMAYLDGIAGGALDFSTEDKPRELLFEYARYARSGALDENARNYQQELLHLQMTEEAKRYAETTCTDL